MTFLEQILARLEKAGGTPVVQEIHGEKIVSITGTELLAQIMQARSFLRGRALNKNDRCAILAPNSIDWIALDLALMAEGIVVVPLNTRQTPGEIAGMLKDCTPAMIFAATAEAIGELRKMWPGAPPAELFENVFDRAYGGTVSNATLRHETNDVVTIIYTSGTSGEPKGVGLNEGNVSFMLGCTNQRLDQLMAGASEPDRVFQYAPFCFAAAWILLLTSLSRNSVLSLSMDLTKLGDEIKVARYYFR